MGREDAKFDGNMPILIRMAWEYVADDFEHRSDNRHDYRWRHSSAEKQHRQHLGERTVAHAQDGLYAIGENRLAGTHAALTRAVVVLLAQVEQFAGSLGH